MKNLLLIFGLLLWGSTLFANPKKPNWQLGIVVDQSGSMTIRDPEQFTILIPAVLADLSDSNDSVFLVPQNGCHSSCNVEILNAQQRSRFKDILNSLSKNAADSSWTKPVLTAINQISNQTSYQHNLVTLVYDDDGQDSAALAQISSRMTNPSNSIEGFVFGMENRNPSTLNVLGRNGFEVHDSSTLLIAFSELLKLLLNAKKIDTANQVNPNQISVIIPQLAVKSWLVVIADSEIRQLSVGPNHLPAKKVHTPPDTGYNFENRAYEIIEIDQPTAGQWQFFADTASNSVDWILLNLFDIKLECTEINAEKVVKGLSSKIPMDSEFPITCKIISSVPFADKPSFTIDGKSVTSTCDANQECTLTANANFLKNGKHSIEVNIGEASGKDDLILEKDPGTTSNDFSFFHCQDHQELHTAASIQTPVEYGVIHSGSANKPKSTFSQEKSILSFHDQKLILNQTNIYQATEQDLQKFKSNNAKPGDWISLFSLSKPEIISNQVETIDAQQIYVFNGKEQRCSLKIISHAAVNLSLSSPSTIQKLGSCDDRPSDDASTQCLDCGACSGLDLQVSYASSQILPKTIDANLKVTGDPLPRGVSLYYENQAFNLDESIKIKLDENAKDRKIPLRLCADYCPSATIQPLNLTAIISVNDAYDLNTHAQQPSTVSTSTSIKYEVLPSSILTCWWPWIKRVSWGIFIFFILFGFMKPIRFSKKQGKGLPVFYQNQPIRFMRNFSDRNGDQIIRSSMPKYRWYKNDYLCIVSGGILTKATANSDGALVTIILKKSPSGQPCAYLVPNGGVSLKETDFRYGLTYNQYPQEAWRKIEKETMLSLSNKVYVINNEFAFVVR